MRNKELIANVPSISCVENYFLGWCKEQGIGAEVLYGKSYLPASEILHDFLYDGARFESYGKIERVMDTAERYGASKHFMAVGLSLNNIDSAIQSGRLVLIEVNEKFFENISLKPWRNDHYIWLTEKTADRYSYLNNYPLSAGEISAVQLTEIYKGHTLVYWKGEKADTAAVRADTPEQINNIARAQVDFLMPDSLEPISLRDAVGILKITRRRLLKWLEAANDVMISTPSCFLSEYCFELEKIYVRLEAAILRRMLAPDKIKKIVDGIMDRERELSWLIKENIA